MDYWKGQMDWPLDKDWKCPTCEQRAGLEWGMVHGQCRCNVCHTQFTMRDSDEARAILTIPQCRLKPEYETPLKMSYQKNQVPIDEMDAAMIDEFMPYPTH